MCWFQMDRFDTRYIRGNFFRAEVRDCSLSCSLQAKSIIAQVYTSKSTENTVNYIKILRISAISQFWQYSRPTKTLVTLLSCTFFEYEFRKDGRVSASSDL